MEQDSSKKPVFSDVHIFYAIAKESYESMLKHMEAGIRPKKNGEPGCIKTPDPERKSFKAALITIVFCGVFLEALLHLLIVDKKGVEEFKKVDKKESYEGKLSLLECKDTEIKKSCK